MNWVLGTNRENKGVEGFQGRGPTLEVHICSTKDFVAERGDTEMFNGKSPAISSAAQGQLEALRRDGSGTGRSLEVLGSSGQKKGRLPRRLGRGHAVRKGRARTHPSGLRFQVDAQRPGLLSHLADKDTETHPSWP